ncbi:MAG TPA: gamma-glutamyltransferase [Vitreimonas sp.]|nr:gamma-glutamyltransferase [Vitreimonas sp.]
MDRRALLRAGAAILALSTLPAWAQTPRRALLDYPDIHHPVIGERGMVVSQSEPASRIGADVLRRGGNAVDAAIAVSFALAVTLPRAGNIGGDGFMLAYLAESDETIAVDYRSTAPRGVTAGMFLDAEGRESRAAVRGHSASAVPGTVAGLARAHERWGSMPWVDLLAPAIALATDGVILTHDEAFALDWAQDRLTDDARRTFYGADNAADRAGELLRQPALAQTLRAIAADASTFYRGDVARQIAASMQRHGGHITLDDLAAYRAVERTPLRANYRGFDIAAMAPPSGGGVSLVQSLNILEHFDIAAMGAGSADATHVLAETMRLAYADRTRYVGDPDFVDVPLAQLTSDAYAAERARLISMRRATDPRRVGAGDLGEEGRDTTHFSVADARGNAVSVTTTLGDSFGSGAVIETAGFLLNNQMKNFALEHGRRDGATLSTSPANALAPGKRMMSTMSPTMAFRSGRPWIVLGTPGGSTIHNTILQILVNVIDHRMNIAEATSAPRIHQQWRGALNMEPGFSPDTVRILGQRGHETRQEETMGSAQSILIENGLFYGAADPRRPGAAAIPP